MRYSEELLPEKEKERLEQLYKRGLITRNELGLAIGEPEALQAFFEAPTTKRISVEEFEEENPEFTSEWWQSFKKDIMQEEDELWYWDTIFGFAGSRGILLVRGDTIVYKKPLCWA